MQKYRTDNLYIIGLNIVTDCKYDEIYGEVTTEKFLKWIAVENTSSDYSTEFVDIKTNTKYYPNAFEQGDLYVDLDTVVSMSELSSKEKLSMEEINAIIEKYRSEKKVEEIEKEKLIYKLLSKFISNVEKETVEKIVKETIVENDIEIDDNIIIYQRKRERKK